eukprot:297357-Pyramimonas_sp.AAC.2
MFSQIANLCLNLNKCQIVGCRDLALKIAKSVLKELWDPADELQVVSWAVYSGVPTGPDGHLH